MRRNAVSCLAALAAWVMGSGLALGQVAREEKSTKPIRQEPKQPQTALPNLGDLLTEALKNNPDIRVAEAKVAEATAKLNRTRNQVIQKVTVLRQALDAQTAQVAAAEKDFNRVNILSQKGTVPEVVKSAAQQKLLTEKVKLATLQAELPFLLGRLPSTKEGVYEKARAEWLKSYNNYYQARSTRPKPVAAKTINGPQAEKLRKALETLVPVKFEKVPLKEILEFLEDRIPGISFRTVGGGGMENPQDIAIDLTLKQPVTLGALLQAIRDTYPDLRFAIRDYGILVTWKDQLPPDALLVEDFLKSESGVSHRPSPKTGR